MARYASLGELISPAPIIRCGDESYPVLSMTMRDGIVLQSERFKKSIASKDQSEYKVVKHGQLVVGFPIDEGVLYIQKAIDAGIMSPAYNVWDVDTTQIDPDYLELCLHSPQAMMYYASKLRGTTARRRSIPTAELLALSICVPNMNDQKKAVALVQEANKLIALRKEQLAALDQLVKSRFIELFGNVRDNEKNWVKVSLKSVAEVRGRVGWKGYKKDDLRENGPLVLGATHLTESGCVDLSSPVYLSREKYEESPEIMLQKNDLIFTQRGNTIGKVGLLENDIGEATINPCVLILRPLTINPIYFKTYFVLDETKSDMWSLNAGSAQPMITQKGIGEYMLMLPPLELQEQFATFVEQTDKSKSAIQRSLDELETLKKALMQKYFG